MGIGNTKKETKTYYELWYVPKKGGLITVPERIPESEFDEEHLSRRCFAYRVYTSQTQNGVAVGTKTYGAFVKVISPRLSEEEMAIHTRAYNSLVNKMK